MEVKKAVILAAGKGKRLRPITYTTHKAMIKIKDKPIIEHLIEKLNKLGINDIAVVLDYLGEQIMNYFGDSLTYLKQDPNMPGTAGGIYAAKEFVGKEPFVALYSDLFFEDNLEEFIKNESTTIGTIEVEDASRFGRLEVNGNKVINIVEKDGIKRKGIINAGIYLLDNKIFDAIEKTNKSSRGEYEITDSFKYLINMGHEVLHHKLKGYWYDVGTLETLNKVKNL